MIPSWPLIVGLAALARALAQPTALLNDPDTYLHIAAGRWMLTHLALPVQDPFSHSLAGAAWVPHEWLAEIILALVYGAAGWSGLVLLAAACFAASIALLTRYLLRYFEPFSALIAVTLGAALVLGHLLVRPHLLALPLLVIWSGELFAARDSRFGAASLAPAVDGSVGQSARQLHVRAGSGFCSSERRPHSRRDAGCRKRGAGALRFARASRPH